VASGVLLGLAQPEWGTWSLAPVCLLPLLLGFRGASARQRVVLGWLAGTAATAVATVPATVEGARAYFGLSAGAAWGVALLSAQVFGAGSFALFALLAGDPAARRPVGAVVRTGAAFVAAEFARCKLFTGLPWMLLAYSLQPVPLLAQAAALGGVLLVSGWLACFNACVAETFARGRRVAGAALGAAIVAGVAAAALLPDGGSDEPWAPGSVRLVAEPPPPESGALRVRLVQADTPQHLRTRPAGAVRAMRRLVDLSADGRPIDLLVWPENAVSTVLPFNAALLRDTTRPLADDVAYLLLGAPRATADTPPRLHTSAVLLGPERRVAGHHDKLHRLPFAEYLPWPLGRPSSGRVEIAQGERSPPLRVAGHALGALICYEVLFSELARASVRDGAGILVNLSNDSWLGRSGGLYQHLAAGVFRAIETRRPVLRATNTGITSAIDSRGRVVARLPLERPGTLDVFVVSGRASSPYSRVGDGVAWAAVAFALFALARDGRSGGQSR
jgi:apolipoprotein N-acyltransferase